MVSRVESAAATRRALVDAATRLLDEGGPDAVTLRAVGARAGVSRGAPYGHFPDKEHLLGAIAEESWTAIGDALDGLLADQSLPPAQRLERALTGLMDVGRHRPHAYALMFSAPADQNPAAVAAVSRTHDQFLRIVAEVTGDQRRAGPAGALLMTSVHGIVAMENSGHLTAEKWNTTGDELLRMLIDRIRS
ncbi:TetR/AcrR family transcriptional regulator [Actinoplanes derwentensis]|uniref:DNA-binding transcriptional regulator, AcrR family n=1 Tax=Actinoplanes derwentensis TaxID=113562 RepID=A0A1H1Y494_9ACTN|nr:TetR/AcrR family transcriptional regulator [Actinoplanes derwentensis]GID86730.1 TetR family transcriptional regulator [Actinoplanes derwentensis]SDT16231.1 DNA-binding transcriptional regulator, AcrR family [Actinoplanes derwentensis]